MNTFKALILSGALVLTAGAAMAQNAAGDLHDAARIQQGIYNAQSVDHEPVLQEGRASAVGAPRATQGQVREPFYFSQASSGIDANAN